MIGSFNPSDLIRDDRTTETMFDLSTDITCSPSMILDPKRLALNHASSSPWRTFDPPGNTCTWCDYESMRVSTNHKQHDTRLLISFTHIVNAIANLAASVRFCGGPRKPNVVVSAQLGFVDERERASGCQEIIGGQLRVLDNQPAAQAHSSQCFPEPSRSTKFGEPPCIGKVLVSFCRHEEQ